MQEFNYYKALGLTPSATQAEIKKSYRTLAKKYHPDANPGNQKAEEMFKAIAKAYDTLSDETKKAAYDQAGDAPQGAGFRPNRKQAQGRNTQRRYGSPNMSGTDFGNVSSYFESFFGFSPKGNDTTVNTDEDVQPMKTADAFKAIFGNLRF